MARLKLLYDTPVYVPRTVQLSDAAYATLAALKSAGESFSDAVLRLAAERKRPLALLDLPPPDARFDLDALRRLAGDADRARLDALGGAGGRRGRG